MAPAVTIDNTPDLDLDFSAPAAATGLPGSSKPNAAPAHPRTLLLAPPSVAAHPHALTSLAAAYDRAATDIQMLDRVALRLVALPADTYDVVLVLDDASTDSTSSPAASAAAEQQPPPSRLSREVLAQLVPALKPGGALRTQSGGLSAHEVTEAILAGLVQAQDAAAMTRPLGGAPQTVTLKLGGARRKKADAAAVPANAVEAAGAGKRKAEEEGGGAGTLVSAAPAGVGFVNGDEPMDEDSSDDEFPSNEELQRAERIDPDSLLTDADRLKPVDIPEACKPNSKRRRACKDCTCGLAERLQAEDRAARASADAQLAKLSTTDLNEVDFTVQGKVGSCGNCALGDAFRCDGCPYIGLPAFKPGEEVRLLRNDVQL